MSASTSAHDVHAAAETRTRAAADKAQSAGHKVAGHPVVQSSINSVQRQMNILDKELEKNAFARDFEARTKVPKTTAFIVLATTFFISIYFNVLNLAPAVTNLVGFAVPAWLSIQALESSSPTDDKHWLTYWVAFSSFTLLESIALRGLIYFVPYWFVIKSLALVYLQLPSTRGAAKLYDHVIRPVFVKKLAPIARQSAAGSSSATSSAPVDDYVKTTI